MFAALLIFAAAAPAGAADFTEVSGVKVSCLENIRGKAGRARVEVVAGSGALHETERERGVAHLLEHLLLRPLGFDDGNAQTAWDYTMYHRDVRATELSTAAIDLVKAIAAIGAIAEDARAFDVEREVVLRELELRGSRESRLANDPLFGATILARDAGGTEDAVRRLTLEDVRNFHRRHYVRGNIAVMLRGSIDCAELRDHLAPHLAAFPAGEAQPLPRVTDREPGPRSIGGGGGQGGAGGTPFVGGFYWYDATAVGEVVMRLVAKHFEQRALAELRKELGVTYSPQAHFNRLGGGGMIRVEVVAAGRDRVVIDWYQKTLDELRASATPLALVQAAIQPVSDALEVDSVRIALSALRNEPLPEDLLAKLTDESMRAEVAKMLAPERAFGSKTPTSTAAMVILALFGAAVLGVLGYVGLTLIKSR